MKKIIDKPVLNGLIILIILTLSCTNNNPFTLVGTWHLISSEHYPFDLSPEISKLNYGTAFIFRDNGDLIVNTHDKSIKTKYSLQQTEKDICIKIESDDLEILVELINFENNIATFRTKYKDEVLQLPPPNEFDADEQMFKGYLFKLEKF